MKILTLEEAHDLPGYSAFWAMADAESFQPVKSLDAAKMLSHHRTHH